MKINLQLVLIGFASIMAFQSVHSQSKIQKQPLPIVKYNDNVNAPLTSSELAQLREVYGEYLQKQVLDRAQRVKDIKNILRNRVEIKQFNSGDIKPCPLLSEVPLFDYYVDTLTRDTNFNPKGFNPLKYKFNFYGTGASLYKVDNTNYYIIIKSQHQ